MQKIKSLKNLIESFKKENKLALVINGHELTYDDIYKDVLCFALKIYKKSKGKKLNIGISSNDPYENIISILACVYAGSIPIPMPDLNLILKDQSLSREFKVRLLIVSKTQKKQIIENIEILKFSLSSISFKDIQNNVVKKKININDTASILLTSGTTGIKKGVMLSHINLMKTSKYINNFMSINKNIIEYLMVPVTNSFGFARLRCIFLKKGCLVIDSGLFNPLLMLKRCEKYKINSISGVPSTFAMLISLPLNFLKNIRKNLIWAEIGSAPMQKKHKIKLLKLFPNQKIVMHYGLTEASRSTFINLKKEFKKIETIGKSSPGINIEICDGNRKIIKKKNTVGEIVIKGCNVAKGYCNFLSKDFINGKFYSGDLGSIDKNGYIYFHGRKDEMINVGGLKISPIVLENIINRKIPLECEFAIYASPYEHNIHGQVVGMFLKKKINLKNKLTKINNLLFLNGIPKEGRIRDIIYVRSFPKTNNGKIKRNYLKYHLVNTKKYL